MTQPESFILTFCLIRQMVDGHLSSSQLACCAVKRDSLLSERLSKEAKKRQANARFKPGENPISKQRQSVAQRSSAMAARFG